MGHNRTIGRKANKVRVVLMECDEPEIILEDLLLSTVLNKGFTSLLLEEAGVLVPDHLQPRFKVISRKYNEIKDGLVSHRKGDDLFLANRYLYYSHFPTSKILSKK